MKVKKYLILTIASISLFFIYGSLNKVKTSIELYEDQIQEKINNFNSESDRFHIVKKETSNNILFSSGTYLVSTKLSSEAYETNFSLRYRIPHNFINIFLFEELPIKLKVELGGKVRETLQAQNLVFLFKGNIKTNGNIDLSSKENNFSIVFPKPEQEIMSEEKSDKQQLTGMHVNISDTAFFLNYDKISNTIKFNINNKQIYAYDLEDKDDNIKIDNLSMIYSSNLNDQNIGSFGLNILKIKDGIGNINIDNFNLNTGIEMIDNSYKILLSSKVDTFEIMDQKKSRIDIRYSIKNLNKSMMKFYKDFTSKYAIGDEISADDILEAKNAIIDNLKTGISLQVENMQYQTEDSEVQILGEVKISPPKLEQKNLNLVQNTNFNLKIKTKGEISEMINTLLLTNIDNSNKIKDTNPEIKKPEFIDDKFNLDLKYENNVLTINNFQAPTIVNYFIFNWLTTINNELGLDSIDINEYSRQQEILSNMEDGLKKGLEINRR